MNDHPAPRCHDPRSCACPPALPRRDFLKLTAAAAVGGTLTRWPVMAGPFTRDDFTKLVPADKKLHPDWVKSLFERGTRTTYRWPEAEKIGMPIGGICAGQLYLGGDGRLWHWDIFNQHTGTGAEHYAKPLAPVSPVQQGFALRIERAGPSQVRALDHTGWRAIEFTGEYPIGFVEYRDPDAPVRVSLEAFSPFIPLNHEDSSLPATVLRFTVKNTSADPVTAELAGWLQNATCLHSAASCAGVRRNRIVRREGFSFLECSAEAEPATDRAPARPDIGFDDFEQATYAGWSVTGTAFGPGPVNKSNLPAYQGDVGAHGQRTVNSHATAPGADVGAKDAATGTLTSKRFRLERDYVTFLIGGGSHKDKTCVHLLVGEKPVLSATGRNDNRMQPHSFDVRPWAGQEARLRIVDEETGGWGNIGIDDIVLSDTPRGPSRVLGEQTDFGTMGLALLRGESRVDADWARTAVTGSPTGTAVFTKRETSAEAPATQPLSQSLIGSLSRSLRLPPGASATVTFVLTWHFPNFKLDGLREAAGRWYATKFASALAVAEYVAQDFDRLASQTRLWHDTWYDSTLPYWFLDRTFLNTSILATSTCHRFGTGRFWGWEGVGCCHGTCGHVWQYAHAMARLFPELERITRERVDFGFALKPDGAILFRGEFNDIPAIDAQAGTILRALREHQMSADASFLRRNWPAIKQATKWLIAKDGNGDGLIESNQHNTLDTDWFGPVAWLSGLYLAALAAAAVMAQEMDDPEFAGECRRILDLGRKTLVAELFDAEYFVNKVDQRHLDAINSGTGCEIDQVFGESWARQVGLPRVLPEKETRAALQSLWRYNFTPDVGPYRAAYKAGRWYAMPGEAGLLMCTFPRADWDYAQAKGKGPDWAAGYFNECMNGFEYQVAGHMIWEGLVQEGLAVTRAVHDRYHAARRNPWNEVECGDHYARSKASYGVFLAACGYEHHGPAGRLAFAPRLTPEQFQCAFTTAEGWGSYRQESQTSNLKSQIAVQWGRLRLRSLGLALRPTFQPTQATVRVAGTAVRTTLTVENGRADLTFAQAVLVNAGETLTVELA